MFAVFLAKFGGSAFRPVSVKIRYDDVGSLACERIRDSCAESLSCTCDDGDFALDSPVSAVARERVRMVGIFRVPVRYA